jgi:hypothetical protein
MIAIENPIRIDRDPNFRPQDIELQFLQVGSELPTDRNPFPIESNQRLSQYPVRLLTQHHANYGHSGN